MSEKNIIKRILYYMNPKQIDPKMVKLWSFYLIMNIIFFLLPKSMIEGNILILAPIVVLFVYALTTKDVMSSLILGTFSSYILWYKLGCVGGFFDDLMVVLADEEDIQMYMSFFLCGGIIIAMKRSGSTKAFADFITSRFGKNEKMILAASGVYAGATSIDDYVSALTAGASFSPLMEAIRKPKLALAYVVRTLSINVSEMLPFGAWGYFVIYQIANAKNVESRAEATHIFIQTIPFMFYCIVACVIALLFAVGIFPKIGPMKKAYQMMEEEGIQMGAIDGGEDDDEDDGFDENNPRTQNVSVLNLILPIIVIVVALIATDLNCYLAFGIAAIFTGVLYVLQGLMTISDYVQCTVDGFLDMMDMVMILMIGYCMQEVMYAMGMEAFVQGVCNAIPIPSLIPFLIFVFFCCEEYLFSLNYTLFQIAIPVLMVVLSNMGANVPLCLGALISASLFGANACVVSDLGVVSARSCGVKIYEQYIACQPYFIISAVISGVMYLVAGFVLG
ncbi:MULTISPECIES: Na+/H+ antiporter NhaC family protein [Anaerostipes]|uniref:Na+/H+ antiporter NhaC family protein n=1 Tax=Anaerostipes TaxID=207244 RepID=UPI001C1E621E|nr:MULTISPECIES: Na+/H+ antiporter NhaC family protein [Anaerostipes]MCI5624221.1 hypothetical protein [Anaerostipes sp.]